MKIAIYGLGVVGSALDNWLSRKHHVLRRDPDLHMFDDVSSADMAFVCVPTPEPGPGVEGALDTSAVQAVLAGIQDHASPRGPEQADWLRPDTPVVIRSTLWPGVTDRFQATHTNPLLYAPEFLTESTAVEDELFPARHIIGTTDKSATFAPRVLELLPEPDYYAIVPARVAEVIKLATNAFYATKVTFFNQIYDLCQDLGVDYESVRASMVMDPMTASEHIDVHHDGYRGFGGKCLPKDAKALLATHLTGPADHDRDRESWESSADPSTSLVWNALRYNNRFKKKDG